MVHVAEEGREGWLSATERQPELPVKDEKSRIVLTCALPAATKKAWERRGTSKTTYDPEGRSAKGHCLTGAKMTPQLAPSSALGRGLWGSRGAHGMFRN